MVRVVFILSVLLIGGCAHSLGYAGEHPGGFYCKGKGGVTFYGGAAANAMFGGGEVNGGGIQADCGDGFSFFQGKPEEVQKLSPEPSGK